MNSMHDCSKILAAAICGVVLAGCNAVEDVQEGPTATLPKSTVVLAGTIKGLGSRRSIVIVNNGDNNSALGAIAPVPTVPIDSTDGSATFTGDTAVVTPFTFGSLPEGSPYNVTVRTQPYGRTCTVANGTGVLNRATPPKVEITCSPSGISRYNLTVALNPAFSSSQGAKVQLTTEEAIYQGVPAPGATSITFTSVLFNGASPPGPTGSPAFNWTVTASNSVGGTTNRCPVSGPTGSNPTTHVTTPSVGACSFTVGGNVSFSVPPGPATPAGAQVIGAGGLTVELRSGQGEVKASATIPAGTSIAAPFSFTFNQPGTSTPLQFSSNTASVFDVAVSSHPAGQTCILADGGFASVYNALVNGVPNNVTGTGWTSTGGTPSLTTAPVAGTRILVWCRAKPTGTGIVSGTFRLMKQTAIIGNITTTKTRTGAATSTITSVTTGPTYSQPILAEYRPFDTSRQNSASNAVITFFDDGTFLYAQHNSGTNLEHGFYLYDSVARTLQFTLHTDTSAGTTFNFTVAAAAPTIATGSNTPGINAMPGPVVPSPLPAFPAAQRHQTMCNVSISSGYPRTISGRFGGYPTALSGCVAGTPPTTPTAPADPAAPLPGAPPTTTTAASNNGVQMDWELTEPRTVPNQMTGAWITRDHREFWIFDSLTFYGMHAGVNGGAANLQSACFTLEDALAASSFLTRRGSVNGCYAWNNPAAGQFYIFTTAEAVNTSPGAGTFPNFVGLFPGGATAIDGRSPSPIPFHVGPAATWFSTVPANFVQFFPTQVSFDSWCSGTSSIGNPAEVLGVRATLNGEPVTSPLVPILNTPVYFCRQ
jgi:hypothetical protein